MGNVRSTIALSTLTFLFFAMGFITVLNDILIPHLKQLFELTYFQAALVQFCFFGAYFITGSLWGKVISKIGYPNGVISGFVLTAIGCILFWPAASSASYPVFLGALFILASGVVLLQTAGNPFVTLLSPGKEARNLTLIQAFNSLGTTLGPIFGSVLIIAGASEVLTKTQEAESVQIPYAIIAGVLILLTIVVKLIKLPDVRETAEEISALNDDGKTSAWQYKHLVLGAGAIFAYVGAEVSIGSFLINTMEQVANISHTQGAKYIAFYWGGAMVGRFIGTAILIKTPAQKLLAINAIIACILIGIAIIIGKGYGSVIALIAIGLFNSIMFPSIFSLATHGLGKFTSQASGIICMAIVGGAIIPPIQGAVIDVLGNILISYIIPVICYLYIIYFAQKGYKAK